MRFSDIAGSKYFYKSQDTSYENDNFVEYYPNLEANQTIYHDNYEISCIEHELDFDTFNLYYRHLDHSATISVNADFELVIIETIETVVDSL